MRLTIFCIRRLTIRALLYQLRSRAYRLKSYEIPEANSRNSKGIAASCINLLPLSQGEKVNALIDVDQVDPQANLFMATERGL